MEGNNLNVEGTGAGAGAAESQPQASSQAQPAIDENAAKLLELLEGRFATRFDELSKNFTGQLEGLKKVQGDIDRSRNEFRDKLAQLNKLTKQGLSQDEAIEAMERQSAESERFTNLERQLTELKSLITGNSGAQTVQNQVAEVFAKYGLDPKDARVAPALAKQYASIQDAEVAALKVFHSIHTSPNPNAAQQPALQGGAGRRDAKDISNINDPSALYDMAASDMGIK